jgi:hypothetical protein
MMKAMLVAGAAVLAFCALPALGAALRAESDNFIIYSEGSESGLRKHAETLEQFDTALRRIYPVSRQSDQQKLTIYLLATAEDVNRAAAGTRRGNVAGWFLTHGEGSLAVSNRETWAIGKQSAAQRVLLHEYMHFFQMRNLPGAYPAWLREGLAEYFATMEFERDGTAHVGKPPWDRAYSLLKMPPMKAEVLLFVKPGQLSRDAGLVFYGRSWLLTHMANHDPEWKPKYSAYLTALNRGEDARGAAVAHLGDLNALDAAVAKYLRGKITYSTLRDPVPATSAITVTRLEGADEELVPLKLERRVGAHSLPRMEALTGKLQEVVARFPKSADALYELAQATRILARHVKADDEGRAKRLQGEAQALVDRLLVIEPQHPRGNLIKGRWLMGALMDAGSDRAEDWRAARSYIVRANRANPRDPLPLRDYFESFVWEGKEPPKVAFEGIEQAFVYAPEINELRVNYAWSLARSGDFDRAEAAVLMLANDPHEGRQGEALLEQFREMRKTGRTVPLSKVVAASSDEEED